LLGVTAQGVFSLPLVTLFDEYPVVMRGDFPEGNLSLCSAAVMEYVSSSLVRIPAFISDSSFFLTGFNYESISPCIRSENGLENCRKMIHFPIWAVAYLNCFLFSYRILSIFLVSHMPVTWFASLF